MRKIIVCATALLLAAGGSSAARVPKIYNALITSDENLSPSQAYPLIEPVLRTTALGVAFPPLVQQQRDDTSGKDGGQKSPQLSYHGALYPVAYDPYLPYGYHRDLLYPPLPYYHHQQPLYIDYGHYQHNPNGGEAASAAAAPQQQQQPLAANAVAQDDNGGRQVLPLPPQLPAVNTLHFKKNPDIPDVIPPLPVVRRAERTRPSAPARSR